LIVYNCRTSQRNHSLSELLNLDFMSRLNLAFGLSPSQLAYELKHNAECDKACADQA